MTDRIDITEIARQQLRKKTKYGKAQYMHRRSRGIYEIVAFAAIESTLRPVVVYRNVNTGATFTRPEDEFFDGRFEPISEAL